MKVSPIVQSTILALIIDACSNVIAQRLKAWNDHKPFVFDHILFIQFAVMTCISAPINFHWQAWLEKTWPQYKTITRKRDDDNLDAEEKEVFLKEGAGRRDAEHEVKVRDWPNVWMRWFTDCITIGAIFNTLMFLILMGTMKGKGLTEVMTDVQTKTWKIIWDGYKMWPIANFASSYVPVERRIVFFSCCGLLWNIYLTFVAIRL
ncbi:hypothetical protein EJ04DRAFT_534653 [Polyplosphaeria fusca]|uniref:Integral membrane protein-like protein n=1 Tax=Polyplosphaeria fusca TaxID=682080 RepID=A0A9P4R0Z9_9PLEO|nr:hypothetical protein EJ04DRAFT_534653 [Polyplosphaeria fusca]